MAIVEPKVTGVGGVFFKSPNQEALSAWYRDVLGLPMEAWHGVNFEWGQGTQEPAGSTVFSVFSEKSTYYGGSFMINFRVQNLEGLVEKLKAAGARVEDEIQKSEYGNFGWVYDPDGNKIELWESASPA
jgi:catechol 2,3-dioxygenase-like lactoylglutathione lyase family enzyme